MPILILNNWNDFEEHINDKFENNIYQLSKKYWEDRIN